jgi:triacylglycerol lipase
MLRAAICTLILIHCGVSLAASSNYAATRYPIVLAHGFLGFSSEFGIDYFYGIASNLESNGATVYTANFSSVNGSDVTGEELLAQVQSILAVSGAAKVNLIGHSQGSQSVRYVAAAIPGKIASVTSIDGVVGGSSVADYVLKLEAQSPNFVTPLISSLLNAFGSLIDYGSSTSSSTVNAQASLNTLSSAGAAKFNKQHPAGVPTSSCGQGAAEVDGVRYYSWSGDAVSTNWLDISDLLLEVTSLAFGSTQNDGLVARCATHLGTVISDSYDMNHLDAVNQVFGLVGSTDPVALYRQQANRLKLLGL